MTASYRRTVSVALKPSELRRLKMECQRRQEIMSKFLRKAIENHLGIQLSHPKPWRPKKAYLGIRIVEPFEPHRGKARHSAHGKQQRKHRQGLRDQMNRDL